MDRTKYIGASDNKYVRGSFDNKVFSDWWAYKINIIAKPSFSTLYTKIGDVLESLILDSINMPIEYRKIKKMIPGTKIGCNYDSLTPEMVVEIKTMKIELAKDILLGYSLPTSYKGQLEHELIVAELTNARIYILPLTENDYKNPFAIKFDNLFYKDYTLQDNDKINEYKRRLFYLNNCMVNGLIPSDKAYENFINE